MDKQQTISLAISSGLVLTALISSTILTPTGRRWTAELTGVGISSAETTNHEDNQKSVVLQLVSLSPEQRTVQLEQIANGKPSLERNRARYLLASDLLAQYEGGKAIRLLENLETDYPSLAPYILLKRGRAYELTNDNTKAQGIWQELIKTYPNSPIVAEALYLLGRSQPQYWEQAIAEYPEHYRSQEIVRQRLKDNPNQPQLLLFLAKYDSDAPGMSGVRDRLVKDYAKELKSEDWQVIADGYWDTLEFAKAGKAYQNTPHTPRNFYRAARGLHIDGKKDQAKEIYKKLITSFPNAEETGLGLRRLASISPAKEALTYLDIVIQKFPQETPEALLEKAKILDSLKSSKSAAETRQLLLEKYPESDATANYRWQVAQKYAVSGDLITAWQWARPITTNNINSDLAAKAAFWIGKWAQRLNRPDDAKASYEYILANHPQSYYAWRAAVFLGWNVGDFNNVRYLNPTINKPQIRPLPPAGTETFKELFLLGQDWDAWTLFEAEVGKEQKLTVEQQFTDGLLKITRGKYLQGINRIWKLTERQEAEDIAEWQNLRQSHEYWYALFPFPYEETIINWSQQRQLNPLLVTSLIRQESRFEKEIRSPVGATGLMQVMPGTGEWVAKKINLTKYSLTNPEDNVNLGTWYLDHTHEEYSQNSLLAVASYNAGPGNVAKWLKEYNVKDPDTFIEKIPFPETKGYVESVFSNYWNYLRLYNPEISQLIAAYSNRKYNAAR